MEKNEVITLEYRGFIKIEGVETKDFLLLTGKNKFI